MIQRLIEQLLVLNCFLIESWLDLPLILFGSRDRDRI